MKDELGSNVAIEYTRDSPFFRQNLLAFEATFTGVSEYAQGVQDALAGVDTVRSNGLLAFFLLVIISCKSLR